MKVFLSYCAHIRGMDMSYSSKRAKRNHVLTVISCYNDANSRK